jgi:hypothetical protein
VRVSDSEDRMVAKMKFICLTECETDRFIWINIEHITALESEAHGTTVALSSKTGYEVQEDCDAILDLISSLEADV